MYSCSVALLTYIRRPAGGNPDRRGRSTLPRKGGDTQSTLAPHRLGDARQARLLRPSTENTLYTVPEDSFEVGNERERCQTGLSSLGRGVTRLEDIRVGTSVRGISPQGLAKVVGVEWYGDQAIK